MGGVTEFGSADLGDQRLTSRLIAVATALGEHPGSSLPDAFQNWAATKGAYRFFSNDAVEPADILAAHRSATIERLSRYDLVLAVQDTTFYNFSSHPATKGLGPFSHPAQLGFCVHSCLAVSPDGVPLGLLGEQLWIRSAELNLHERDNRAKSATDGKESARWHDMLEASTQRLPASTRIVTIADREGDVYEFFVAAARLKQDLLVRVAYNRRLHKEKAYLWDKVEQAPVLGQLQIEVQRGNQPARSVNLELRSAAVTLHPPKYKPAKRLPPISLSVVLAREVNPPAGQEPICWRLLTTLDASTAAGAEMCLRLYTHRWKIERYHYTLKSGCRVEELQLETVDRLHRALAVYSIVAWRLLSLTYAARQNPNQPCTTFLSDPEWQLLYCKVHRTTQLPETPPDLQTAVLLLARLGGFLARRHDGAPGVKVLWRGYRRLQYLLEDWELFQSLVGKG